MLERPLGTAEIDRIIAEAKRMKAKQPQGAATPSEAR